jgi:catechol 2,3-dioxygenase-like lactoylglutathione lyase family enzyme
MMASDLNKVRSISDDARRTCPSKLAHVIILTFDITPMRDWYGRVLEAGITYENDQLCFMTYDDEHHRIGFARVPELGPRANTPVAGVDHFAFTYGNLAELLLTYRRLKEHRIEPFWAINHGPTTSLYYRDPDGNKIELQVDNFTVDECARFFADGNFDENPMGILFEPDDWIRRYEGGEDPKQITIRPPLPKGLSPWDMFRP